MKPTLIASLLLIAGAVGLFIYNTGEVDSYSNFSDAMAMEGESVQVVCDLSKDKEMIYDPLNDPNYFTFHVKDKDGLEKKVVYYGAKPQDFELSEAIVLTGKMRGEEFIASDILMKCPSKYKDEEIFVREETS